MLRSGSVIPHLGVDAIHVLHGWVRNVVVATTTTKECRGCGNHDKRSAHGGAPVAAARAAAAWAAAAGVGDRRRAAGGCGATPAAVAGPRRLRRGRVRWGRVTGVGRPAAAAGPAAATEQPRNPVALGC